jgi:hypothetical protein
LAGLRNSKLRLSVRTIWWTAMALAVAFSGMALWLALALGDPMSIVLGLLAAACVVAGYGAVSAIKRRDPQTPPPPRPGAADTPQKKPEPA